MARHIRLLAVLLVLSVAFVAFAVTEALHYGNRGTFPNVATPIGFVRPARTKPIAFDLPALSADPRGARVTLAEFAGRPLVINLWATTCPVCVLETPALARVYKLVHTQVAFVGLDTLDGGSPAAALAFARRASVTYPLALDSTGIVATAYDVPGLPITFFVTASGKLVGENIGALTVATLEHYLHLLFAVNL